MKTLLITLMAFVAVVACVDPAFAAASFTRDKEGLTAEVSVVKRGIAAYVLLDAVEESNWILVRQRETADLLVTAAINDELANGVQIELLESTLDIDETPIDFYSHVVLGVTLTGIGTGGEIRGLRPGRYKLRMKATPLDGAALAVLKVVGRSGL